MKDYPFVKFAVLFILGIIAEKFFQFDLLHYVIIAFLLLSIFILIRLSASKKNFKFTTVILASVLFFFAGSFMAYQNDNKINSPLSNYYKEKNSKLFAEVLDVELERSFEIVFTVRIDSIFLDNKRFLISDRLICKFRGDSLQRNSLYGELNPGNKIFLTGTYQKGRERRNPGEFDYNKYLNSKGITGLFISYETDSISIIDKNINYFASGLFSLRKLIDDIIVVLHNAETTDLLRGLILADRSGIDVETKNAFVNSGVIHILAVSGLNVGYVILIFIIVFGRFSIYTRSILTIIGLVIFMLITGTTPPVVRATIMGVIIIMTFLSNRSTNIFNSISIAAIIILIYSPNQIYDPGFQLSFSAVLSTAIIYPYIKSWVEQLNLKLKWLEKIFLFMGVSFSAQVGTIPFTLVYFAKLSIVSIIANLFVIPISGIITAIAFITIFLGSLSYSIAYYFAYANDLLTIIMMNFIRFVGTLDFSFLWIRNYSFYDSIVFYLVLGFFLFVINQIRHITLRITIPVLSFAAIIFFSAFDDENILKDGRLSIIMIDVGQGDSFLIKFPNGKTALIDAGEANPYFDNGEKVIIPLLDYLGINKIDYGFISHLDLDHYGGFVSLISNSRVKEIYRPLPDSTSKSLRLEKFLRVNQIKTLIYSKISFNVGNTKVYFLNDPYDFTYNKFSSNDKSGVIKVVFGKTSFLFVGDCEYPAEYYLVARFGKVA